MSLIGAEVPNHTKYSFENAQIPQRASLIEELIRSLEPEWVPKDVAPVRFRNKTSTFERVGQLKHHTGTLYRYRTKQDGRFVIFKLGDERARATVRAMEAVDRGRNKDVDIDRVRVKVVQRDGKDAGILMEAGDGDIETDFMYSMSESDALAMLKGILEDLRRMRDRYNLGTVDVALKNLVHVYRMSEKSGRVSLRVLIIDYGGFQPLGTQDAEFSYHSPAIEEDDMSDDDSSSGGTVVECSESNCLYACGILLLKLAAPRVYLDDAQRHEAAESFVRGFEQVAMKKVEEAHSPEFVAVVQNLLNYNAKTRTFEPTQGDGAEPRTLDSFLA